MAALKYQSRKTKWLPTICILSYQAFSNQSPCYSTNVNHLILNKKAISFLIFTNHFNQHKSYKIG